MCEGRGSTFRTRGIVQIIKLPRNNIKRSLKSQFEIVFKIFFVTTSIEIIAYDKLTVNNTYEYKNSLLLLGLFATN